MPGRPLTGTTLRAFRLLKHTRADCVSFAADDAQARLYLLNLNRLTSRDNVYKKAKLIELLCRHHSPRDLAKRLVDSKTAIEKLNALCRMGRELSGEGAGMMFPCYFCAKQYRVLPLRR